MEDWIKKCSLVILALSLIFTGGVSATIINVPAEQTTIQAGIDASINGDTVLVQPGAYTENIIYGGKNIIVGSLYLTTGNPLYIVFTVIDGDSAGTVVSFINNEDSTAALTGFTIQNGLDSLGGGIYCMGSDPVISYNRIINCAAWTGGGICCYNHSYAIISDNYISDNVASSSGGGISCRQYSDVKISGNIINDNTSSQFGGGIYCHTYSAPLIEENIITGNYSINNLGGGICCLVYATPVINRNTIIGNSTHYQGGGIASGDYSNPEIKNNIIWENYLYSQNNEVFIEGNSAASITYCDIQDTLWPGTGNISCDPFFCEPGSDDYHIDERSCCAGAGEGGVNIGAMDTDCGPKTINVPDDYATIQAAIDASYSGDTVLVEPGTYIENIDFNGKNIIVGSLYFTSADTSYISSTIIDGGGLETVVLLTHNEDSTAALIGFSIQNGVATTYGYGGGIYCYSSDPLISHNRIINNSAPSGGGGICCNYYSRGTIANNFISGNSTTASGGGIFCRQNSNIGINNNIITDNTASQGGGIFCWSNSNPTLNNNTITGNSCNNNGGGIYIYNSSPVISNSIIWGNNSAGTGDDVQIYGGGTPIFSYCDVGDSIWPGTGNISCNPMFCDPDNDNYSIYENSCCLGTGEDGGDIGALGMGCWIETINVPDDYATIQAAINACYNGDTVLVQPGTYTEDINFNGKNIIVGSLYLTSGDTSYIPLTIITGTHSGIGVISIRNGEDSTAVITGFTIQGGLAALVGGGIFCLNSNPIISYNIIRDNYADDNGGGIYCYASSPFINNNKIYGNTSNIGGGIFCVNESYPKISNNIITSNEATKGGGISCLAGSDPEISNNIIARNEASYEGGGLYLENANLQQTYNNTIYDNSASSYGGGVYCRESGGVFNAINTILWSNSAHDGDQIFTASSGSVNIEYSNIQNSLWPGEGNISCDPMFCDTTTSNYYLDVSSCCIGAGEGGADIGAYGVGCGTVGYEYLPGDVNMFGGTWPPSTTGPDVTYLVNFFRGAPTSHSCLLDGFWASADANGDCNIIGSDVTKLVNVFRGIGSIGYCVDYPPAWPPVPEEAPPDWPDCE